MTEQRKMPVMVGVFAGVAADFISYKRSLGYKYESEPKCLSRFCSFAEDFGVTNIEITEDLAYEWCAPREDEAPKNRTHRITCIRQFAVYLNDLGYPAFIMPEVRNIPKSPFTPHIFTHDEIKRLFQVIDNAPDKRNAKSKNISSPAIFRMLYGCGMRVSEVCGLRRKDVDIENGILTLHDTKNGTDRYVPLSASVQAAVQKYAYQMIWDSEDEYFFKKPDRSRLAPITIYGRFRDYLFEIGISHGGKNKGPRLHDLRHTFAVHVLQKWIASDIDVYARLPVLSAYMGHKGIRSTAIYLRLTAEVYPELLKKAEKYSGYVIPEVSDEAD